MTREFGRIVWREIVGLRQVVVPSLAPAALGRPGSLPVPAREFQQDSKGIFKSCGKILKTKKEFLSAEDSTREYQESWEGIFGL